MLTIHYNNSNYQIIYKTELTKINLSSWPKKTMSVQIQLKRQYEQYSDLTKK